MKKLFYLFFTFATFILNAQNIKGTVKDSVGNYIPFSNILIRDNTNPQNIVEFSYARNGLFSLTLKKEYREILLEVTSPNYQSEKIIIENHKINRTYTFNVILQKNKSIELKEVIVVAEKKPFSIKNDTITFNIDKYKEPTDKKVQDVIKRLPGIEVNEKSGEIKYKGKSVETVTLDGDNLFGYNYSLGTRNINIDMLEQVQAIENYTENPLLKGIESEEKVSLNLKLKKGKTDYSGNIDFGLGYSDSKKILNNTNSNILGISKKIKSFGVLSYNNLGINHTPFDYFSGNKTIENLKDKELITQKVISETLFSSIIDDERSNINNLIFSNYNIIFKVKKKLSIKANVFYYNDKISNNQVASNINNFESEIVSTLDNYTTKKNPNLYRGDIEIKYNTSKKSLLEYKSRFIYENINTNSDIIANNVNFYYSKLNSKNTFLNQKLIFTNKLNDKQALQLHLNHSYNNIPQFLELTQSNNNNSLYQNSNFKKNYFDLMSNLIGKKEQSKYSIIIGYTFNLTPFTSYNNISLSFNDIKYLTKTLYNISSYNVTKDKWTFSPSYSLRYFYQSLNDNSLSQEAVYNILFEPSILIRYKINNKSFIAAKTSIIQNSNTEENIFKIPVITNNRLSISNNPSLEIQKSKLININYYNNNLYKNFYINLGINYQINNGNYFSNFTINETETILNNFFLMVENRNLSFNLSTEKYVNFLSTNFKLKSSYSKNDYKNIINSSELRNNFSNVFNTNLSIKTAFNTKLNFENNLTINFFSNKTGNSTTINNNNFSNSFKIKYKHSDRLFSVISNDSYIPNLKNRDNNYNFLDFSIIYRPSDKKYEFNLVGKNLLNNTIFNQIQITDFSVNTLQNNLISRYIFINFTYNF